MASLNVVLTGVMLGFAAAFATLIVVWLLNLGIDCVAKRLRKGGSDGKA